MNKQIPIFIASILVFIFGNLSFVASVHALPVDDIHGMDMNKMISLPAAPSDTEPTVHPQAAQASPFAPTPLFLGVCWGGLFCGTFPQVGMRLNNALLFFSGGIFLAIFIIGAFALTLSAGRDQWVQTGKNMMKGSLTGLVIVTMAYAIYRTTIWILYGGFL